MQRREACILLLSAVLTAGTVFVFAGGRGLGVQKLLLLYSAVLPEWFVTTVAWICAFGTAYGMIFTRGEVIYSGLWRLSRHSTSSASTPASVRRWQWVMSVVGLHRLLPFKPASAALFVLPLFGVATSSGSMLAGIIILALSDIPTYTVFTVGKARTAVHYFFTEYPSAHISTKAKVYAVSTSVFVATTFYGSSFFLAQKGIVNIQGLENISQRSLNIASHIIAFCAATINISAKLKGLLQYFSSTALGQRDGEVPFKPRLLFWNTAIGDFVYTPAYYLFMVRGLITLAHRLGGDEYDWGWHVFAYLWAIPAALAEREFTVRHMKDVCFLSDSPTTKAENNDDSDGEEAIDVSYVTDKLVHVPHSSESRYG